MNSISTSSKGLLLLAFLIICSIQGFSQSRNNHPSGMCNTLSEPLHGDGKLVLAQSAVQFVRPMQEHDNSPTEKKVCSGLVLQNIKAITRVYRAPSRYRHLA